MKKVMTTKPVSADRFKGTPGEIVSIVGLNLDFSSRVGRKSGYDELLEKLAAGPKDAAIRFWDLKCRPSVEARAKKRGYLIQFAESGGQLYVRCVGSVSEDVKESRRAKIAALLKASGIDGATAELILMSMRKAGEVVVQEGGNYALSPFEEGLMMPRHEISRFGWFAVIWAGIVSGLLTAALHRNVPGTTRLIFFALLLLALIVGIERVRVALARQRRDREELKQSAARLAQ